MTAIIIILAYPAIGALLGVLDTLYSGKQSIAAGCKHKGAVAFTYMAFWPIMLFVSAVYHTCRIIGRLLAFLAAKKGAR